VTQSEESYYEQPNNTFDHTNNVCDIQLSIFTRRRLTSHLHLYLHSQYRAQHIGQEQNGIFGYILEVRPNRGAEEPLRRGLLRLHGRWSSLLAVKKTISTNKPKWLSGFQTKLFTD